MNGFIRLLVLSAVTALITSCASTPAEEDLSIEGVDAGVEAEATESESNNDVISEEEKPQAPAAEIATEDKDLTIEDELAQAENPPEAAPAVTENEPAADELSIAEDQITKQDVPQQEVQPSEELPVNIPAPSEPSVADVPQKTPSLPTTELSSVIINDLKFRANDTGGTVVIEANKPLNFTTRSNPDLHQFIVEVENASLPDRLKHSLNTRDIKGSVGSIDAYQNPGSTTARIVIQLREGVVEPTVQNEGNSLLIVANSASTKGSSEVTAEAEKASEAGLTSENDKVLQSKDLSEFLAGNTKFYGKKISIETKDIDIRDALNLITEESGLNMIISDEVKGTLSLKLRQVPWDQALTIIMKARKLGYTRQGNVLRIASLLDLKAEEEEATKLAQSRKTLEPLKVRMFPISYAKVDEIGIKIKEFLGDRGKVASDNRTNSLVVTDIQDNLERVAKILENLDTQPSQVLIEGKIVEAKESFSRSIGVNWGASGSPIKLGSTARGPVNMNPSFGVNPTESSVGNFNFNLSVGTLDFFGTLQAALSIQETEEQVKVISAPRILTMTNEPANITQTTEVAVRQVTQSATGGVAESFTFKPLTMKLDVTPQVTADGSVIMKVNVNRQFQGADTSGSGKGAFSVNSREANTKVLVKNGETAVIGGIYQSDATDGETGVPWFREIPFLGYLFKSKNVRKDKSELLIFLTPRIIGQSGGATDAPPAKNL